MLKWPKTRSEYIKAHRKLWDLMIKLVVKTKRNLFIANLKREAGEELFGKKFFGISSCCFPCEWTVKYHKGDCSGCLFVGPVICGCKKDYEKLVKAANDGNVKKFIYYARRIRNWKVRKEPKKRRA